MRARMLAGLALLVSNTAWAHGAESTETAGELKAPHDVEPEKALPAPAVESPSPSVTSPSSPVPAAAAPTLPPRTSEVPVSRIPDTTWRQSPSEGRDTRFFDATHFLLELRFGPYSPRVDEEFGGTKTPYADYFGTGAKFYFGVEADWLPIRIPYVGRLGVAGGWGTVKAEAKAKTSTGEAGSDTSLHINPMYADAVLRVDGLLKHFGFPIVPYIKGGLGIGMWQASGPSGTSQVGSAKGEGSTLGLHVGIGGALALNALDQRTARSMRAETGIQHAYLWGEWMRLDLDGFGDTEVMHVGTETGVAGIAIEY